MWEQEMEICFSKLFCRDSPSLEFFLPRSLVGCSANLPAEQYVDPRPTPVLGYLAKPPYSIHSLRPHVGILEVNRKSICTILDGSFLIDFAAKVLV